MFYLYRVHFTAYFGGAIVCSGPPGVSGGCAVCLCVRVCINTGSTGLVVDVSLGVYVATWERTVLDWVLAGLHGNDPYRQRDP